MKISLVTFVPADVERAFDLSVDIGTHLESMANSGERAVDGVTSGLIALGESVTWNAKHFGVTWQMTSKITEWDRPSCFVDEQVRGPFSWFRHVHRFRPVDGGTEMYDEIEYRPPFGVLGEVVDRLVLNRHLRKLIDVRNDFIVAETRRSRGEEAHFEFRFTDPTRRWNRLFGINPLSAGVTVTDGVMTARFGPWTLRTDRSNIVGASTTGPYKTWRVAGPARLSLADRGLTFATNTDLGLCIQFDSAVPALDPLGVVRHPSLTVTVADPAGLARALALDEPPRHVDLTHGSVIGALRAIGRWTVRKRSVAVETPQLVSKLDTPEDVAQTDAQDVESGVGPVFHRAYRIEITDSALSAEQIIDAIRADPNVVTDGSLAPFVKNVGDIGCMAVGDRYTVETAGPWSGPVEITVCEPDRLRLATLHGHMEAGLLEMRARSNGTTVVFEIESWARSGDRAFDVMYDKIGIAKAIQSEMWVSVCEAVGEMSGGRASGPVAVIEEQIRDLPE